MNWSPCPTCLFQDSVSEERIEAFALLVTAKSKLSGYVGHCNICPIAEGKCVWSKGSVIAYKKI